MAGIDFTIGGNLAYLDTLKKKFNETAADIRRGFGERIGQRAFDGLIATAQALPQLLGKSIKAAADNESAQVAFTTLIGDAQKAGKLVADVKAAAAATPFEIPELNDGAKKLIAFGESADTVVETLLRIGDVSSGIGAPIGEIADLYGKARVQGTLFAEDLNQLAGRGVPIFQELGKAMGVAPEQVKKLASEGKVTFPYLEAAFENMTSRGGQFAGMMEAQSKTLNGTLSNLTDTITQSGAALGEEMLPALKEVAKVVSDMFAQGDFGAWGRELVGFAKTAADIARNTPFARHAVGYVDSVRGQGLQDSFSGAATEFNAGKTGGEVTSRDDIAAALTKIEEKKAALRKATDDFAASIDDPNAQQAAWDGYYQTVQILDRQAIALTKTTDAQLAYNKATQEAENAARRQASAVAAAKAAQEKLSKSLADQLDKSREKQVANLPLTDQIEAAKAELAKIQGEFSDVVKGKAKRGESAASIANGIDKDTNAVRRGKDTEVLTRALKARDELAELTKKQADEERKIAEARNEAVAQHNTELEIMRAELSGSAEKVAALKREAEMRKKIAEWVKLGVPEATATKRAEDWAKADADLVAAQERRRREELMQGARDAGADGEAIMNGRGDDREMEKRKRELVDGGLTSKQADATARNEADLRKITDLQGQRDGLTAGATVTAADSMRRIGGGGGVAGTGLDYQKEQTSLMKDQVRLLEQIASRRPDLN